MSVIATVALSDGTVRQHHLPAATSILRTTTGVVTLSANTVKTGTIHYQEDGRTYLTIVDTDGLVSQYDLDSVQRPDLPVVTFVFPDWREVTYRHHEVTSVTFVYTEED